MTTNTAHKIGTHEIIERSDGKSTDYKVGDHYFDTLDEALLYSLVRTHSTAENPEESLHWIKNLLTWQD